MSDFADDAAKFEEQFLADALNKKPQVKASTGFCFNCDEIIEQSAKNKFYCDVHCRDDHGKREKIIQSTTTKVSGYDAELSFDE